MMASYPVGEYYIDMEVSSPSNYLCYSICSPSQSREFEFQMCSVSPNGEFTSTNPADELFYKGKLLPLQLPPRLQMVQKLTQSSDNSAYAKLKHPLKKTQASHHQNPVGLLVPEAQEDQAILDKPKGVSGTTMNDHITSFNQLVTDLMNMDVTFEDEDLALMLMGSLLDEFEYLETTLLHGKVDVSLSEGEGCLRINVVEYDGYSDFAFAATPSTSCSSLWLLDSACSHHMTPNREWFFDFKELKGGIVYTTNNSPLDTLGIGSVRLRNQDGSIRTLTESKGLEVRAKDGIMRIISGALVIMKGIRKRNNVYYFLGSIIVGTAAVAASTDEQESEATICALGHVGEKSLKLLIDQGLLKGARACKLAFYVWGPSKTTSLGGTHYYALHCQRYTTTEWVAERMNQTLVEKVRCMLSNARLAKNGLRLWSMLVTLSNRLPSTTIGGKTPLEKGFGVPATDYDSLHGLVPLHTTMLGVKAGSKSKEGDLYGDHLWCERLSSLVTSEKLEQTDETPKQVEFEGSKFVPTSKETDVDSPMVEEESDEEEWRIAMNEEIQSLKKNQTWKLASLPKGKKQLGARNFVGFGSVLELELVQMDVKLHFTWRLDEEIYMTQPDGFKVAEKKRCASMSPKDDAEREYMSKVPYASAVGSLMYAMVCTRPDISHAIGVVSRYMHDPGKEHWQAVKWILRYILNRRCWFGLSAGQTRWHQSVGSPPYSQQWLCLLQGVYGSTEAVKEAIWLQGLLGELGMEQKHIKVHCDSQSAIHLAKNQVYHARTKHIDVRYHFVREILEEGGVIIQKIRTTKNPANMLTKVVTVVKFKHCLDLVNIVTN
ncbi:hypothetical protein F3Y22_tig00110410pilonHSYRG00039 [Hibiscus syriacus]|uniref:Retrovirus-related Pol polyprotein from transposon TNT 1-94-like beta-barrel domain-containing protein n=1 Tax=Hibiscus syriacus TaxID=106335 RepID=A0A6A3ASX6_HIBSY|nr:hypothetical protein F3Y22_tig00110410pilonHSYRG00039 [Hibiscus syriacus]